MRRGGEYFEFVPELFQSGANQVEEFAVSYCLVSVGLHCAFNIESIDRVFDKIIGVLRVPVKL